MKLYVFDSCPFCVRVKALIGLKGLDCEIENIVLGPLPKELEGKVEKFSVPMLMIPGAEGGESVVMPESADIIRYLDQLDQQPILDRYEPSPALDNWLTDNRPDSAALCYPRMPLLNLPELASPEAVKAFSSSRKEAFGASLEEMLAKTEQHTPGVEDRLPELENILDIKALLNGEREINLDDFHAFAELRNLAMVKEINWPDNIEAYIKRLSETTGIALYPAIGKAGS